MTGRARSIGFIFNFLLLTCLVLAPLLVTQCLRHWRGGGLFGTIRDLLSSMVAVPFVSATPNLKSNMGGCLGLFTP